MSRQKKQKTIRIGSGLVPLCGAEYKADYDARLKAAGLDRTETDDMDTFRLNLARKIDMFNNEWPGCCETICQRMRGCMAPGGNCSNVAALSDEEVAASWPETMLEVRRALDKAIARHKAAGVWPGD